MVDRPHHPEIKDSHAGHGGGCNCEHCSGKHSASRLHEETHHVLHHHYKTSHVHHHPAVHNEVAHPAEHHVVHPHRAHLPSEHYREYAQERRENRSFGAQRIADYEYPSQQFDPRMIGNGIGAIFSSFLGQMLGNGGFPFGGGYGNYLPFGYGAAFGGRGYGYDVNPNYYPYESYGNYGGYGYQQFAPYNRQYERDWDDDGDNNYRYWNQGQYGANGNFIQPQQQYGYYGRQEYYPQQQQEYYLQQQQRQYNPQQQQREYYLQQQRQHDLQQQQREYYLQQQQQRQHYPQQQQEYYLQQQQQRQYYPQQQREYYLQQQRQHYLQQQQREYYLRQQQQRQNFAPQQLAMHMLGGMFGGF